MLYRSYQKNDAPDICELMDQSFGMNRYVSDPKALRFFLRQYLYSCLSEATYTRVAVENGKVVAIIMGNANRRYRLLPHLPMILLTFYCSARMALRARKSEQTLADDYHLHKLCAKLLGKHKKEFDGVLTLFMVSESLRGHGVGKTLLSGLFDELRTQGVRRMYLFTDTT
ncbi:MAG: GNAT family N-acetyltransferase, partial [Clostridia bacterium]